MTERWDRLVPPVVPATAHLGEEEIAAVDISDAAAKHLADCAWCQTRRSALSDDERDELAALLSELDGVSVAQDALKVAGEFTVPSALAELLHADLASMPSVEPAQLWRMVWNGHDALGVVLEKNSWWVTVAPLTTDLDLADEYTALCDAHATSLSLPTAVFMRAAATVPQYTLAQFLGDLRPAGVADPTTELLRLQRACLKGIDPSGVIPTGRRLEVDDWDRQEALDGLVELMSWFESATSDVLDSTGAIVGGDPEEAAVSGHDNVCGEIGRHRGDFVPGGESVDVVDALKNSGKSLPELVDSTGFDPSRLLDLLQGSGKPTQGEREVLAEVLGVQVRGSYPDVARLALLEIVSEPEHRPLWKKAEVSVLGVGASGSGSWPADPRGFGDDERAGGPSPRHATEMITGESLRPFLEQMFTQSIAARSVTDANRNDDGSLDMWRDYWRDRLAHRKH